MDEVFDILVIGSGPAGVSAALTARHRGKTALLITTAPEDSPLYKAEHVDNYPGLPAATGAELVDAFLSHAEKSGVKLMRGRALAVADLGGTFGVSVGSDFVQGRAVVLACGLTRAKPYPGEAEYLGRGVSYCATCDGMLYRGKNVAVIGLSSDAPEEAEYLREVDERSIVRGSVHTSFTRRLIAFAIDLVVTAGVLWAWRTFIAGGSTWRYDTLAGLLVSTGVAFMLIPCITRGQTIGHMVLRLRVVRPDGDSATCLSYIARYGLLFWVFLLLPVWVSALYPTQGITVRMWVDEYAVGADTVEAILSSVYITWFVTIALRAVISAFKRPFVMLNGVMTDTRVMSEAQVERLRAARNAQSLADELAENDLGASSVDDAFDTSFDSVYSDELDSEIDEVRAEDE